MVSLCGYSHANRAVAFGHATRCDLGLLAHRRRVYLLSLDLPNYLVSLNVEVLVNRFWRGKQPLG